MKGGTVVAMPPLAPPLFPNPPPPSVSDEVAELIKNLNEIKEMDPDNGETKMIQYLDNVDEKTLMGWHTEVESTNETEKIKLMRLVGARFATPAHGPPPLNRILSFKIISSYWPEIEDLVHLKLLLRTSRQTSPNSPEQFVTQAQRGFIIFNIQKNISISAKLPWCGSSSIGGSANLAFHQARCAVPSGRWISLYEIKYIYLLFIIVIIIII